MPGGYGRQKPMKKVRKATPVKKVKKTTPKKVKKAYS